MHINQQTPTYQTTLPIDSIVLKSIIEYGESPTAIILAITFLIAVLFGSVSKLIKVILIRR